MWHTSARRHRALSRKGIHQYVLSELFLRHRSIRRFQPRSIDDTLVEKVLREAVAGTSSSGNLNCVSMVLTRDPGRKRQLCEMHFGQDMVTEAPLAITFCADWFRTREWLRRRNARDNFDNFLGYHVAAVDASLLAQSVSLGFESVGLGICYLGTTLNSMAAIADFLDLPETCVPVTTIVVGYPAEDPAKRDRLPMEALVHEERYHRPTGEEIDATFADRERKGWERYMSNPATKAAAEERGITCLAQYYTSEIKYCKEEFVEASESLLSTLRAKGFLPKT